MSTTNSHDVMPSKVALSKHLAEALKVLSRAYQYAAEDQRNLWEYAADVQELRSLGLFSCDLRCLIARGYVIHGTEVGIAGGRRQFQSQSPLILSENSCFVITPVGLDAIQSLDVQAPTPPRELTGTPTRHPPCDDTSSRSHRYVDPRSPHWNPSLNELTLEGRLVKRYRCPAYNQQSILQHFQQAAWPIRLENPLLDSGELCPKRQLQEAIRALNRNQVQPLLRFSGDGSARGILWKRVP